MTTPTNPEPNPEPGHGPDDPDLDDPFTVEDILAAGRSANTDRDQTPAEDTTTGAAGDDPDNGDDSDGDGDDSDGDGDDSGDDGESGGRSSQASRLVARARARWRLLRGTDGRLYATEPNGPALAVTLRGRDGLRTRLARHYYDATSAAASGSALSDALAVLEGQAERCDPEPVALRVARSGPQTIVLDLGTSDGRCVVIEPGGWRIAERSPVLFRRSTLTGPLPDPARGGSLDALRGLLNVDDDGWQLIVSWLVAALLPDIPHPILTVVGEQGTAKTTAARLVVSLVDPSPAPLRTPPREMRSWAAAASASWIVGLDNVSSIPAWFSDTLCKAVTGDGIVERALHTDDDLNVLTFRRCIALTAIDTGALAGDLAERLLTIELDRITRRRPDAEIAAAYETARPHALGALLDLTARVLEVLPTIRIDDLPRMADYARILAALDQICGWNTLASYTAAAAEANRAVLESHPVAQAVIDLIGRGGAWSGTAGQLLDRLTPERPPQDWPRTAKGMSSALTRLAPALRQHGIAIERPDKRGAQRDITLRAIPAGGPTHRQTGETTDATDATDARHP